MLTILGKLSKIQERFKIKKQVNIIMEKGGQQEKSGKI